MTKQAAKAKSDEPKEPSSQDELASLLAAHKEDHYNEVVPVNRLISTGSLKLDSFIKIRSGGVVRLIGKGAELGKSSEAFVLADNYMKVMPKSKTFYVKAEGRLTPEIRARSGLKFTSDPKEWKDGTVFVLSMNIFEKVAEQCETLIKKAHALGEHLCIIIDALDGLILKDDYQTKGIDGNMMVAGVPKLTKLLFRRLALPITHYDALLIITSQYTTDIKIDQRSPATPHQGSSGGGSAIMHQSDYVLEYGMRYEGDYILEDPDEKPDPIKNKILGNIAKVKIVKSATGETGNTVKVPIKRGRIGSAIWVEKEIGEMLQAYDLIKKDPDKPKSTWLYFDKAFIVEAKAEGITLVEKVNALNGLFNYIESDRQVFEWLYARFRKMLGQDEA